MWNWLYRESIPRCKNCSSGSLFQAFRKKSAGEKFTKKKNEGRLDTSLPPSRFPGV